MKPATTIRYVADTQTRLVPNYEARQMHFTSIVRSSSGYTQRTVVITKRENIIENFSRIPLTPAIPEADVQTALEEKSLTEQISIADDLEQLDEQPKLQRKPSVIALVPAHNEQAGIGHTIDSLMDQTWPLSYVLIIADNCTDQTVKVVRQRQKIYGAKRLRLMKTENNVHKKAGALNQGFASIKRKPEFIFGMDADTILDRGIIEAGVTQLMMEPNTAGVCSSYRTLPLEQRVSHWQKYLWRLQNIEFGLANAWRVENYKSARVLPGVAVMFRTSALKSINKLHKGTVWATDSLVEDYRLTLELKDLGWDVKSSLAMISWSDVPLRIRGKGGLFDQRQRWYSGTVDEIRRRGLGQHSRYEAFTISLLAFNFLMRAMLYTTYAAVLLMGGALHVVSVFLLAPILAAIIQFYRWYRYCDQRDKWQGFITITLLPNELYAIFREFTYFYSSWLSYRRPDRAW